MPYTSGCLYLELSDRMPFGKHKGEEIEDLIVDHPSYLGWLFEDGFKGFGDEVIKKMEGEKII